MRLAVRLVRFFFIEHRSLTVVASLYVTAMVVAFAEGFWLMSRLANALLVLVPVAFVWSRINLRGLQVEVERPTDRLQEGNVYEERITVRNTGFLTKLWLEVEDISELPGHKPRRVVSVPPRGEKSWRVVSECRRRGLYDVGPVRVSTGDPFGLFRASKIFGRPHQVLVYPRALDLQRFDVPPANLPGEGRFRRPTFYLTPNASGVRDYQPGDGLNRIHWRTTARRQELMVKLFELDPASDVWVVLDLQEAVHAGSGDESTEEYGVRIAASIARYFLVGNRNVGYLAYGRRLRVEEPERGIGQFARVLEALALARANGDVALSDLIDAETRRFGRHTTVVAITPSTDERWAASLQLLSARGVKVAAVLLEPNTFGGEGNALMIYSALAVAEVPTFLVKRGDDLLTALGSGAEQAPAQEAEA